MKNALNMKNILGLDLGTNSIGWALIDYDNKKIVKAGSRIIPMDAAAMSSFEKGNLQSAASVRTSFRRTRRLYQRATLRRERLFRILNIMGFLPKHFQEQIDFEVHPGKFKNNNEPLLPYRKTIEGKNEFIFMDSFQEMLNEFQQIHPELIGNKKIPYDWTIYYLRKKALKQAITREELAWIILNFNTKRGYYQLRGNDESLTKKEEEYMILKVSNVEDLGPDKHRKNSHWFEITYENKATQRKLSPVVPKKIGDEVELIVTTTTKKDGTLKISLRDPKEDDWALRKKRTESILDKGERTVGEYIFDSILNNPDIKVRGKLIHTIERSYYKKELELILDKQAEYIPELQNQEMMIRCVEELYHNNESHRKALSQRSFRQFIVDDIIFYQHPLKSKKNEISDCPFEFYIFKDKENQWHHRYLKCIPKSNPIFQEFRLWQFIQNLRIYEREKYIDGKLKTDVDVTDAFIKTEDDIVALFEWLNEQKEVSQDKLLKSPIFGLWKNTNKFRWNYVEDKIYPCNKTHAEFVKRLANVKDTPTLNKEQEMNLWHILYSVEDRLDLDKALHHYARKNNIDEESFVEAFINIEPYDSEFGSYSEKATKKLLALMRCGKYWNSDNIDSKTKKRIYHILDGEVDDSISIRVREKTANMQSIEDFRNLPVWLATYVVYNQHAETSDTSRWESPEDIDMFLKKKFKAGCLRNPVVESVLTESIRVVRDIWKKYGRIDEVHIEMGRNLKQNKKQRLESMNRQLENQRTNFRIRALLQEFVSDEYKIKGVHPNSPSQQELFKIFEENILNSDIEVPDDIQVIVDALANPTVYVSRTDIMKYRLWLEQQYCSPYTGQPIKLSDLFTPAYEIEHVIPQSRYFDDSLSNKVICESEVNKAKGNMLAYEFILEKGSSIIKGTEGKEYKVLDKIQYEDFIKKHYGKNRNKMRKLLMDDIPDGFINRQLNDSRYIARVAMQVFSHLVRECEENEAISKHVIASNGSITDRLKKDWGMNDVWNDIIAPRFERMNEITNSHIYGDWVNKDGNRFFQINVPMEISQGFSKKRIDHRHHAMDAIIIACATRDHINYLNNVAALADKKDERYDLRTKLCYKKKTDANGNYVWLFKKPWDSFTQDAHKELDSIIVSFKQNLRVINKMTNYYWHYVDGKKVLSRQTTGDGWAIRKSLHKATVLGGIRLQTVKTVKLIDALDNIKLIKDKDIRNHILRVKNDILNNTSNKKEIISYYKKQKFLINNKNISKLEVYDIPKTPKLAATRVFVDTSFTQKTIESVTDSGIRKILSRHLHKYNDEKGKEHPELAFSPEGLEEMNKNIKVLNGGKKHKPIIKVRKSEALGMKFNVGERGTKRKKFVEADKGTNLFFAIYSDSEGNRSFESIPFNEAVERLKNGMKIADDVKPTGEKLLFTLSPNDLVVIDSSNCSANIYRMVSSTGRDCFFILASVATPIADKQEFSVMNKMEKSIDGITIKKQCHKIIVDRLGEIIKQI